VRDESVNDDEEGNEMSSQEGEKDYTSQRKMRRKIWTTMSRSTKKMKCSSAQMSDYFCK